ncbi:MBL fold metallo-hydrolase [Mesoplasma chauliocola]|uniref:MBL fold metallo-hydrolase n=1 Tax=Mesoplasma chauliocola TaxID=216427 RepID=A0A249SN94_9MOLU|nr:MBL fold metallo-hydrolase [Mesoplasma chauliocola]
MTNFYFKKEFLNLFYFKPLVYFYYLLSIAFIYYFIYSNNFLWIIISVLLLTLFLFTKKEYKKSYTILWFIFFILVYINNAYWTSEKIELGSNVEQLAKVIKIKQNYIILKINHTKFYIQSVNNQLVEGQKVLIKGEIQKFIFHSNYYQFNFKEFLSKDFINYQIKVTNMEVVDNKNLRVFLFNIFNLNQKHELFKLFFLNKFNSDDLLVQGLNDISLKYLINFNFINIFLLIKYANKKRKVKKFNRILFILILLFWSYLTVWPLLITRIVIKEFLTLFKKTLGNKSTINLVTILIMMSLFQNFVFNTAFWYINLIILINSFIDWKVKKHWSKTLGLFIFLNLLNIYFNYQLNLTSFIHAFILSPIIFIYYLLIPLIAIVKKDYLNMLYDVLLLIIMILKKISIIINVGKQNIFFLIFGLLMHISIINANFKLVYKLNFITLFITAYFISWILKPSDYMTMLNVGNANSFVYHNKWNNLTILFDVGVGKGRSTDLVKDFLIYNGINKIDLIFISHNHEDHYNNLFSIKENFKVNQIFYNNSFNELIQIKNITINVFLNPFANSENNKSLVLLVDIGTTRTLFMGDAEKETENYLLSRVDFLYLINLKKVNILQVGHHGSKTSSNFAFLKLINPDIALISGENEGGNKRFPHQQTLDNLSMLNIKYYVTNGVNNYFVLLKNLKIIKK